MKKIITRLAVIAVAAAACFSLFACEKDNRKELLYTDIYVNSTSQGELTGADHIGVLPAGWTFYAPKSLPTNASDTDVGYISSINAFVVKHDATGYLSLYRPGDDDVLFPDSVGAVALNVAHGLIAVRTGGGRASVYNSQGRLVLSRNATRNVSGSVLRNAVAILDTDLIAVNGNYDASTLDAGLSGYSAIYRVSTGKLACRVRNADATVAIMSGYENKYVLVDGTASTSKTARVFTVPDGAPASPPDLSGSSNGEFVDNGESDYYCEITYIGGARFYVHEDWTVSKDEGYTYHYNNEYLKVARAIYHADSDRLEQYSSKHVFLNLSNAYYGSSRNGVETSSFLKDGYMYASYCIYVTDDKEGLYDQYILDRDLNVVLSLSGNFGIKTDEAQDYKEVGFFDLVMQYVDGIGIPSLAPSIMRIYNDRGEKIFEDAETQLTIVGATQQDGIIVASAKDKDDKSVVGAYDTSGRIVIPFKYTKIESFRGYYTIAERKDEDNKTVRVLIGKDGVEVQRLSDGKAPLHDIAATSSGEAMYKRGCYVFKETKTEGDASVVRFGIKNYNANVEKSVIMPATMSACTIYSLPDDPNSIYVFCKFSDTDNFQVYRLK